MRIETRPRISVSTGEHTRRIPRFVAPSPQRIIKDTTGLGILGLDAAARARDTARDMALSPFKVAGEIFVPRVAYMSSGEAYAGGIYPSILEKSQQSPREPVGYERRVKHPVEEEIQGEKGDEGVTYMMEVFSDGLPGSRANSVKKYYKELPSDAPHIERKQLFTHEGQLVLLARDATSKKIKGIGSLEQTDEKGSLVVDCEDAAVRGTFMADCLGLAEAMGIKDVDMDTYDGDENGTHIQSINEQTPYAIPWKTSMQEREDGQVTVRFHYDVIPSLRKNELLVTGVHPEELYADVAEKTAESLGEGNDAFTYLREITPSNQSGDVKHPAVTSHYLMTYIPAGFTYEEGETLNPDTSKGRITQRIADYYGRFTQEDAYLRYRMQVIKDTERKAKEFLGREYSAYLIAQDPETKEVVGTASLSKTFEDQMPEFSFDCAGTERNRGLGQTLLSDMLGLGLTQGKREACFDLSASNMKSKNALRKAANNPDLPWELNFGPMSGGYYEEGRITYSGSVPKPSEKTASIAS